jgi:hypothetical protein
VKKPVGGAPAGVNPSIGVGEPGFAAKAAALGWGAHSKRFLPHAFVSVRKNYDFLPSHFVHLRKKDFSTARRKKDAASGAAMPGGRYPIEDAQDVKNAVNDYNRTGHSPAVAAHIRARAKAVGVASPFAKYDDSESRDSGGKWAVGAGTAALGGAAAGVAVMHHNAHGFIGRFGRAALRTKTGKGALIGAGIGLAGLAAGRLAATYGPKLFSSSGNQSTLGKKLTVETHKGGMLRLWHEPDEKPEKNKNAPAEAATPVPVGKRFPITFEKSLTSAADLEKGLAWGWASVIEKGGEALTDHQGDQVEEEELMKAAHDYMTNSRKGGVLHIKKGGKPMEAGHVVESMVFTHDLQKALGIDLGQVGWLVGYQITHPEVRKAVARGDLPEFSIGGSGERVQVK